MDEILSDENHPEYDNVFRALEVLSFCHTIITEELEGDVKYNASSPDELALLNFARYIGFKYTGIDDENFMCVEFKGKVIKKKLLYVLEFTSDRKRMSVITEDEDGYIEIMCKGADSIILERILKSKSKNLK